MPRGTDLPRTLAALGRSWSWLVFFFPWYLGATIALCSVASAGVLDLSRRRRRLVSLEPCDLWRRLVLSLSCFLLRLLPTNLSFGLSSCDGALPLAVCSRLGGCEGSGTLGRFGARAGSAGLTERRDKLRRCLSGGTDEPGTLIAGFKLCHSLFAPLLGSKEGLLSGTSKSCGTSRFDNGSCNQIHLLRPFDRTRRISCDRCGLRASCWCQHRTVTRLGDALEKPTALSGVGLSDARPPRPPANGGSGRVGIPPTRTAGHPRPGYPRPGGHPRPYARAVAWLLLLPGRTRC